MIKSILIICEGNHCRSPIAEAIFQRELKGSHKISSAGVNALVGQAAHLESIKLMAEFGLDISTHRGRQLTTELALCSDLILVMDEAQKGICEQLIPASKGRVFLLGHWLAEERKQIIDPIGRASTAHREVYNHIKLAISAWLPRLKSL